MTKKYTALLLALVLLYCTACGAFGEPENRLLDSASPIDAQGGLYQVGEAAVDDSHPRIYAYGENQLLVHTMCYDEQNYMATGSHLQLLRLSDGRTIAEAQIDHTDYAVASVVGDTILLQIAMTGKLILLDGQLQIIEELSLPAGSIYPSDNLQTLYCHSFDGGLYRLERASGTKAQLLPNQDFINYQAAGPGSLILTHPQEDSLADAVVRLDLHDGSFHQIPLVHPLSILYVSGDTWLANLNSTKNLFILGGDDGVQRSFSAGDAYVTITGRGDLLINSFTDRTLKLYTQDGRLLASSGLPPMEPMDSFTIDSDLIWSDAYGGYFFHAYCYSANLKGDTSALYFWDISVPNSGEALPMTDYTAMAQIPEGYATAPVLYDRARQIEQQYGIHVRIAEQCDTDFPSYTTTTVTDPFTISLVLSHLEDCLAKYPAGFFDQLQDGNIQPLEIQLVGTLHSKEHNSLKTAIAFALPMEDRYLIAVDSYTNREQDFHHELSHVIDDKMFMDSIQGKNNLYSEETWRSFNPPDFDYRYDYSNYLDYDFNSQYFADSYSCTFPTEDRARIWEYAMTDAVYLFQEEPLRKKLDYYNRCVRESFDTTGWPELLPAEQILLASD